MLKRLILVYTLGISLLSGCAEAPRFVEQTIAVLQEEGMVISERAASGEDRAEALSAPEPTPGPVGLSEEELTQLRPNEIGWVLVLEYHLVYPGEDKDTLFYTPIFSCYRSGHWRFQADQRRPARFLHDLQDSLPEDETWQV